jgi:hypothetical protein
LQAEYGFGKGVFMKYIKFVLLIASICFLLSACKKECIHEYQREVTLKASCTQLGVETLTCKHCQYSFTQPIPVLDHTYGTGEVVKQSTCSEEGTLKYVCTGCGDSKTESIEKIAHTFGEASITKEPNCSEEGEMSAACTVCGECQVVEKIKTNDVHIFVSTVIREATCADPGEGVNVCSLCQYSESLQYELKPHSYGDREVSVAATCTEKGTNKIVCVTCGHTVEEEIPAKGHRWAGATCTTEGTCTACGSKGSKADHKYNVLDDRKPMTHYTGRRKVECQICGEKRTEYYGKRHTYDLDAVREAVGEYARSRGFKVAFDEFDGNGEHAYHIDFFKLELYDMGSEYLVQQGKYCVDSTYNEYADSPAGIGVYTVHINVEYSETAEFGGFFHVCIDITS